VCCKRSIIYFVIAWNKTPLPVIARRIISRAAFFEPPCGSKGNTKNEKWK